MSIKRYNVNKIFITLITILVFALPAAADIEYYLPFESYDLNATNFQDIAKFSSSRNGAMNNYFKIVGSPTRAGNKALKFYNERISDSEGYRTEITPRDKTGAYELKIGNEYWIGWSIYLPGDFVRDGTTVKFNAECLGQIHASPDRYTRQRPGQPEEAYRFAPMFISMDSGNWIFHILSHADPMTINNNYDKNEKYNIGSSSDDLGKWTDWAINFKLDYTNKGDNGGFVKVYKNGSLVIDYTGGNCYNDLRGPYLTVGVYKFSWKSGPTDTNTRTVYYDEIKIGDENSSLSEISPGITQTAKSAPKTVKNAPNAVKNVKITINP